MEYKVLLSYWGMKGWGKPKTIDKISSYHEGITAAEYAHEEYEENGGESDVMIEIFDEKADLVKDMAVTPTPGLVTSRTMQEQVTSFLKRQRWTFAKSYSDYAKHEYIVRKNVGNDQIFDEFVTFIRLYGWKFYFGKLFNTYYEIGDKYYWTMGAPVNETIIINRANLSDYEIKPKWKKKEKKIEQLVISDPLTGKIVK